ncbi:MAG TPA: LapA family protein [Mariprofundaceae bacterium]|nr:LapA family protein [Mariprofundaceae bacterium]
MHSRAILTALLIALPVIFVLQNTQVVEIRFLFWTLSMSRVLIILLLLAIGMLAGWLLHGLFISRKTHQP